MKRTITTPETPEEALCRLAESLVRLCRIVDKPKGREFNRPYLGDEILESLVFEMVMRIKKYVASRSGIPVDDTKAKNTLRLIRELEERIEKLRVVDAGDMPWSDAEISRDGQTTAALRKDLEECENYLSHERLTTASLRDDLNKRDEQLALFDEYRVTGDTNDMLRGADVVLLRDKLAECERQLGLKCIALDEMARKLDHSRVLVQESVAFNHELNEELLEVQRHAAERVCAIEEVHSRSQPDAGDMPNAPKSGR
jgi:hypothetical protein